MLTPPPSPHHSTAPKSPTCPLFTLISALYSTPYIPYHSPHVRTPSLPQLSPEIISSSRDGVDGPLQVLGSREDGVMVDDDGLNQLIDVSLAGDLVVALWDRHQRGAKADGQVVRVHHVVLTVLRQAERRGGAEREGQVRVFNTVHTK